MINVTKPSKGETFSGKETEDPAVRNCYYGTKILQYLENGQKI